MKICHTKFGRKMISFSLLKQVYHMKNKRREELLLLMQGRREICFVKKRSKLFTCSIIGHFFLLKVFR